MRRPAKVVGVMMLCALTGVLWLCAGSAAVAQAQTTIGPIPGVDQDIEFWMINERNIEFRYGRRWLGTAMKVRWGDKDLFVGDLNDSQKRYLWGLMNDEQRKQMSDAYHRIGTMTGPLLVRPRDWGRELNGEIARYYNQASGWADAQRQRIDSFIPPEVGQFNADAEEFLRTHDEILTAEQKAMVKQGQDVVTELGGLIANLEARKSEIAVKGISKEIIALMAGVLTDMATGGAHYTSAAVATAVSKAIELGQHAIDTSQSPGQMIEVVNQQVAILRRALQNETSSQRDLWREMARPEMTIVFVVDCSGSMRGSKIQEAIASVKQGVDATNDRRTEWAIVSFAGCAATVQCRFTMNPYKVKAAADRLSAGGDTPLTYGITRAASYAGREGSGRYGRMIILADGEDNCGERGSKNPDDAGESIRPMFIWERHIDMPQRGPVPGRPGVVR